MFGKQYDGGVGRPVALPRQVRVTETTIALCCVITMMFLLIGSCMLTSSLSVSCMYKLHSDSEQCATVGVLRELLNCRDGIK